MVRSHGTSGKPPGQQSRPTLKTIAYMTGLGVTTVSRALKDAPDIGAATKERVRLVARQVGYTPNRAGVRLRTGRTYVISLILPTEEEVMGLTSEMICGISEALAETPYHLIVTPYRHGQDPMEPVRYVLDTGSADGVIISRTEPDDPRVRYMMERDFPFATHGRTERNGIHAYHDFDNYVFAVDAVKRLVARGRRRLALLAPPKHLTYYTHTQRGFSDAVAAVDAEEIVLSGVSIDDTIPDVKDYIQSVMARGHRPDGIVSCAGGATIGAVPGIEAAGLKLGRDVDMVSKQSADVLEWFRPEMMVTFENIREAGKTLAHALIERIDGRPAAELQSLDAPVAEDPPRVGADV
ncbi:LacI family transcriptional regulator [Pararhizobium mangrovi]|uniref:LacI family DNA-binding transcriptional regulator n=1 Tax=Pararhizobium mangrovi TaxID=2590452 RepID=A0A506UHR8_9HYPH|nr:LacI family transcriptional regulator [Pararhizobium mangrovi]TPW32856.1 LacI family DNA-binding transcriptional regulator [Pararhizobium mangrovi]